LLAAQVLLRRAKAREALDEPSEAAEDMRSVAEQAPSGSKERREATAALPRLEAAAAAKLEAQKEEMLGKLKDLGGDVAERGHMEGAGDTAGDVAGFVRAQRCSAALSLSLSTSLPAAGNNILGRFGMSLDNFKAEKDPATGSYNISFGK